MFGLTCIFPAKTVNNFLDSFSEFDKGKMNSYLSKRTALQVLWFLRKTEKTES